jgi:catechol 2,3-dioxygenase-like lactoylglutathione lyase family enzyme
MPHVLGIDHVAFAAADLEATCAFYDRLFGARTHLDYAPEGRSLVREHGVPIIDSPSRRRTADGLPALSIYFRDPDGNLLELMAADGRAAE